MILTTHKMHLYMLFSLNVITSIYTEHEKRHPGKKMICAVSCAESTCITQHLIPSLLQLIILECFETWQLGNFYNTGNISSYLPCKITSTFNFKIRLIPTQTHSNIQSPRRTGTTTSFEPFHSQPKAFRSQVKVFPTHGRWI